MEKSEGMIIYVRRRAGGVSSTILFQVTVSFTDVRKSLEVRSSMLTS